MIENRNELIFSKNNVLILFRESDSGDRIPGIEFRESNSGNRIPGIEFWEAVFISSSGDKLNSLKSKNLR